MHTWLDNGSNDNLIWSIQIVEQISIWSETEENAFTNGLICVYGKDKFEDLTLACISRHGWFFYGIVCSILYNELELPS